MEPQDLVPELVQRHLLPAESLLEPQLSQTRRERVMKLLGRLYRQSLVDPSTWADFVAALQVTNERDHGHKYGDLLRELAGPETQSNVPCPCDYLPLSEAEKRVFDLTRRVAESSLEPDFVLPALVTAAVLSADTCVEIVEAGERRDKVHCLMNSIESGGSQLLKLFVETLLESEDRSARGVGFIMNQCLQAMEESPYTPSEWLGKIMKS